MDLWLNSDKRFLVTGKKSLLSCQFLHFRFLTTLFYQQRNFFNYFFLIKINKTSGRYAYPHKLLSNQFWTLEQILKFGEIDYYNKVKHYGTILELLLIHADDKLNDSVAKNFLFDFVNKVKNFYFIFFVKNHLLIKDKRWRRNKHRTSY